MDEFLAYLLQFGSLNPRQPDHIASKATAVSLRKDEYFLEAGQVPRQVGFVLEGVIQICYNNKGDEITRNFIDEHHLATDLRGLEYGLASPEYLQAVTDCQLLVFSKREWDELAQIMVGWRGIVHQMTAKHLWEKLARISPMVARDATTRYREFLETTRGSGLTHQTEGNLLSADLCLFRYCQGLYAQPPRCFLLRPD